METGVPILGAPVFFNHFEIKRPVEILLDSSADAACLRGPFPERIPPRRDDADEPEIPVARILEEVIRVRGDVRPRPRRKLVRPPGDQRPSAPLDDEDVVGPVVRVKWGLLSGRGREESDRVLLPEPAGAEDDALPDPLAVFLHGKRGEVVDPSGERPRLRHLLSSVPRPFRW